MKIGYFADGPWSHLALEMITNDDRFEVAFIVPRYDTQDPILKQWSVRLGVDYLCIRNVNQPESIERLKSYGADIFVSMSFNQILKAEIIEATPLGFINCHAGALPLYRGRNILNWVLINDAPEFGVTVHYVDTGIDTGDIIIQRMAGITDEDDYKTLLDRAIILCAELLLEALISFADGTVQRKSQLDFNSIGFYCGRRRKGDEWINWHWPSRRIFNFIRAITDPGPCAHTLLDGQLIKIKKAVPIQGAIDYIGEPGEIVGIENEGFVVKTGDSTILIINIEPTSNVNKLRIGRRFGGKNQMVIEKLQERISTLEKKL